MKIETLIATIQKDATNGKGDISSEITEAVTGLVSRLEGMLPDIEAARGVASKLAIAWNKEPHDTILAWAWTIWPLYHAGRIGELLAVVGPLLPEGQPFGQSEIDSIHGQLLLAQVEGDETKVAAVKRTACRMRSHNLQSN